MMRGITQDVFAEREWRVRLAELEEHVFGAGTLLGRHHVRRRLVHEEEEEEDTRKEFI